MNMKHCSDAAVRVGDYAVPLTCLCKGVKGDYVGVYCYLSPPTLLCALAAEHETLLRRCCARWLMNMKHCSDAAVRVGDYAVPLP